MKKVLWIVVLSLLSYGNANAIIFTKSGNIDPGLFIIWTFIICCLVWFFWSSALDGLALKKYKIREQKLKDEDYEKYKSYYERNKKKKKKKSK